MNAHTIDATLHWRHRARGAGRLTGGALRSLDDAVAQEDAGKYPRERDHAKHTARREHCGDCDGTRTVDCPAGPKHHAPVNVPALNRPAPQRQRAIERRRPASALQEPQDHHARGDRRTHHEEGFEVLQLLGSASCQWAL